MKLKDFKVENFYVAISNSERSVLYFTAKSNPRNCLNGLLKRKKFNRKQIKSFKVYGAYDLLPKDFVDEVLSCCDDLKNLL